MSSAKKLLGDYSNEPSRRPELVVNSKEPFNAETPPPLLVKDFKTPVDLFYVRSHGPTPDLDVSSHKLEIGGEIKPAIELSLSEVQTIGQHVTIDATLTCAGNRRNELNAIKKVKGVGWEISAIGNATWTGVRLRDVLLHAKANIDSPHLHVEFIGEEDCEEKTKYGSSIPMTKAADPKGDVLLAWMMNGKPLTRDHGYPLRIVVPGYIGARSVKWLRKVNVIPQESQFVYQQRDYKLFLPHVNWDTVDALWDSAFSLSELSVQSAICEPEKDQVIAKNSPYTIRGYAVSNGRRITRVDVSVRKHRLKGIRPDRFPNWGTTSAFIMGKCATLKNQTKLFSLVTHTHSDIGWQIKKIKFWRRLWDAL
ncbi:hypothetical protein RvY_08214-2 [Ramazzottius varieornatus]|uniref:Oxidoreductase molybdopterin-binding domain-containing protein n=1 Tax=Ramazzottius varieornatus TaxID=947166 RepID=A0A1D1V505_RAMVA|nr:hypothetical protein RvY_08214-2 [Ramazzottius varieornatus]